MKKKKIVVKLENPKDYFNQYDYLLNFRKNKFLTQKEFEKYKTGKFYKITDTSYVKLPRLTKRIWIGITATLAGLIVAGIATPVAIFYMPHKVTLNCKYLEIVGDTSCRLANDYKCSLKIKDEYLPTKYMNDMNISSIKVNGNKIPAEDFYFTYQTNAKNELVINKKHLGGNIEINADVDKRQSHHRCFFFGYEDFTFDAKDVIYPDQSKVGGPGDVDKKSTTDNMYLINGKDMAILPAEAEPIKFNYNAFIVREDNAFAIKIHALNPEDPGSKLPENLWFRCFAKFAKKNEDFTIDFSSDRKTAILKVNYFVIRDSGSIVPKPEDV